MSKYKLEITFDDETTVTETWCGPNTPNALRGRVAEIDRVSHAHGEYVVHARVVDEDGDGVVDWWEKCHARAQASAILRAVDESLASMFRGSSTPRGALHAVEELFYEASDDGEPAGTSIQAVLAELIESRTPTD